jgi:hypothetical protein
VSLRDAVVVGGPVALNGAKIEGRLVMSSDKGTATFKEVQANGS